MERQVHFIRQIIDQEVCALHFKGYDDDEIEIRDIHGLMHAVPPGFQPPFTMSPWKYDVHAVPNKYPTYGEIQRNETSPKIYHMPKEAMCPTNES